MKSFTCIKTLRRAASHIPTAPPTPTSPKIPKQTSDHPYSIILHSAFMAMKRTRNTHYQQSREKTSEGDAEATASKACKRSRRVSDGRVFTSSNMQEIGTKGSIAWPAQVTLVEGANTLVRKNGIVGSLLTVLSHAARTGPA